MTVKPKRAFIIVGIVGALATLIYLFTPRVKPADLTASGVAKQAVPSVTAPAQKLSPVLAPATQLVTAETKKPSSGPAYSKVLEDSETAQRRQKMIAWLREKDFAFCGLSQAQTIQYVETQMPLGYTAFEEAKKLAEQLQHSSAIEAKSAALFFLATQQMATANRAARATAPACQAPTYHQNNCKSEVDAIKQPIVAEAVAPIVKLALSADQSEAGLTTYVAALRTCAAAKVGMCSQVSVAEWAKREPDNAVPWLLLAGEAVTGEGKNAAFLRALSAQNYNARYIKFGSIFSSETFRAQFVVEQKQIREGLSVWALESEINLVPISWMRHCYKNNAIPSGQAEICDALASKFGDVADDSYSLDHAIKIGKLLNWDDARVQALQDEYDSGDESLFDRRTFDNPFSCEANLAKNTWITNRLSIGHRALAKQTVEVSGKSLAEFANDSRVKRKAMMNQQ